jgi:hypothetical protein
MTADKQAALAESARRCDATSVVYYLSSLDSARFAPVRECHFKRRLMFDSGKAAVETRLSPAVLGQDFDRAADIDDVILSPRHEDTTIDPVNEFRASCSSRFLALGTLCSRVLFDRTISRSSAGASCTGRARLPKVMRSAEIRLWNERVLDA